jgi:predicted nucleotidyltransferase
MEATKSETTVECSANNADPPALMWFKQHIRKFTGKALIQEDILETVVNQAIQDENLIGVLLFGSVASKTHTWKSDIDLFFIYDYYEPDSGRLTYYDSGVEVNRFHATLEKAVENQRTVPYLLHMFSESEVLFDRHDTVTPIIDERKQYFAVHPDIQEEWIHLKELHQVEKKGTPCGEMKTIMQRWDELEDKYSGGIRKRTFFVT